MVIEYVKCATESTGPRQPADIGDEERRLGRLAFWLCASAICALTYLAVLLIYAFNLTNPNLSTEFNTALLPILACSRVFISFTQVKIAVCRSCI